MSYLKLYFGKEYNELTYEDIENYFKEERDESDKIEYKSYPEEFFKDDSHKKRENGIFRTICGLLNSEGGLIVWGAPKGIVDEAQPKRKIFIGELTPFNNTIHKDSIINKIADLLTPSPNGIQFYPFKKNDSYIYIIEVAKSIYSPHQFANEYSMRLDGQTIPAPHHYVEALFKKITYPRLEGYIKIKNVTHEASNQRFYLNFDMFILNQSKLQNEENIVCRVIIDKGAFLNESVPGLTQIYGNRGELYLDPAKSILFYGEVFIRTETLLFTYSSLEESLEVRLLFSFGGKTSPMILSEYGINLGSIPLATNNYNSMFLSINENQYLYEKGEALDVTEKEKLKEMLGR